jgi:hypothetical protein
MKRNDDLHAAAMTFLVRHDAEHLHHDRRLLVDRCVRHLVDTACVSMDTAEDVVLQTVGEIESRHRREYVDLSRTTSFAVFVHDPVSGRKRVFTVADLMALVRTPALASQPVPSTRDLFERGVAPSSSALAG